jgi:hypothetical protein
VAAHGLVLHLLYLLQAPVGGDDLFRKFGRWLSGLNMERRRLAGRG